MLRKLAIIRTNDGIHKCPYGLSVGVACRNAGSSVDRMEPLDAVTADTKEIQQQHNVAVYVLYGDKARCKYADQISEKESIVNCDYGDTGQGIRDFPMNPSPTYPRIFGAMGLYGYYSYPLASYWDYPDSQLNVKANLDSQESVSEQDTEEVIE